MYINPYLLQQETQEQIERYRSEAKQSQLIYTLLKKKAAHTFTQLKKQPTYRVAS
ncbi:MAG: hypothetical protein KC422_14880 [Trueperaceae bacterium]|nr:hypothetical protein [Trueperaceae bacterium]